MRRRSVSWGIALVGLAAVMLPTRCVNTISHSPLQAANEALEFASVAFIEGETEAAYSLMPPEFQRSFSKDEFEAIFAQMHPSLLP